MVARRVGMFVILGFEGEVVWSWLVFKIWASSLKLASSILPCVLAASSSTYASWNLDWPMK